MAASPDSYSSLPNTAKSPVRLTTVNELVYLVIRSVSLVVNYFVSFKALTLDYAFSVGL